MPTQNKNGVNSHNETNPVHTIGNHMNSDTTKKNVECKSLNEAMSMFQQLNISAIKSSKNPFFKNSYADLTSVINACNHGADYGLSFSQAVKFENTLLNDGENKQRVHLDIYVETTVSHKNDEATLVSKVPVLIKQGKQDDAQAMGSSITYAKRYALQAIMGLASDDDANLASDAENDPNQNKETKTSNNNGWR